VQGYPGCEGPLGGWRGLGSAELSAPTREEHRSGQIGVSVVICAYSVSRWNQTRAAVQSVLGQEPSAAQVLLIVDHNPDLAVKARQEFADVTVLENDEAPGIAGARNTGLRASTQPITAFLDDDTVARPGWLRSLVAPYRCGQVVATGGSVYPRWPGRSRPGWLPLSFDWVVGCTYLGLPDAPGPVRNPIGANMSMRTHLALACGGFSTGVGRVGGRLRGCEETELAIRLARSQPGSAVMYVPGAGVDHWVGPERVKARYFVRRCWNEGLSKADVVMLIGSTAQLQPERRHITVVIPHELIRNLRKVIKGDLRALAAISAAIAGLWVTVAGYGTGRVRAASRVIRGKQAGERSNDLDDSATS
jgi:glycosyltransferase involved in cell wall biosynthesis